MLEEFLINLDLNNGNVLFVKKNYTILYYTIIN